MIYKMINTTLFLLRFFDSVHSVQTNSATQSQCRIFYLGRVGGGGKGRSVTPITQFHLVLSLRICEVVP